MMTFTVLQSVYRKDNPAFLAQSLQSIAGNTLLPQKVVLVKDGALTPELEAVIAEWQERLPLCAVGYEKNRGLAYALNFGLRFVDTELVARMDSDDICLPERFEKQAAQFTADDTLTVLGGGIEEFYSRADGTECRKVRLYPKRTTRHSPSLYRGTPLAHPTVMMRTELLRKFGYSERTRCNEDIDLWMRLLASGGTIRTLQEPLLRFRITEGTFRRRSAAKAFDEYRIYARNLHAFNGVSAKDALLLARLASRFLPASLSRRLYLSRRRQNLFKENLMKVKSLGGQVFMKNGHLFEALLQFEENGVQMIKAVQLDSTAECVVEVLLADVELFRTSSGAEIVLPS